MADETNPPQARSRTIRDPIHGDIELTALQAAIVDTRHFQRLRYIRQNGLLHFIFPGAVHTRFAHSLGTMEVARRAFRHLVAGLPAAEAGGGRAYLETAFQLAALLHDVGHCAFSHAIEHVSIKGRPIFGTVAEFLSAWQQPELLALLQQREPRGASALAERPARHELIGLVLIGRIFAHERVRRAAGFAVEELCRDVQALVHGGLPASGRFQRAAAELWELLAASQGIPSDAKPEQRAEQILQVLHELISGTLDVDRLDYLVRDSFHCGVPYGSCDVAFLLASLRISFADGRAVLAVSEKARYALEDMLWSRYQLFVQVLHHKTNVGLNATLQQAMEDAVRDARIERPDSEPRLLAFTDDQVMANIHRASLLGELEDRSYTKALIDRRLPVHLGALSLVAVAPEQHEALSHQYRSRLAAAQQLSEADIWCASARSHLIKPGGLHLWSFRHRGNPETVCRSFEFASLQSALEHHLVHFFVDRGRFYGNAEHD